MSEKKEPVKVNLSTVILLIIVFILAAIIVGIYLEKENIISINLKENENIVENAVNSNTINNNQENDGEDNQIEKIILEGDFVIPNSDGGYTFYKDGKVESSGNISVTEGTYYMIGENQIEMKFTKTTIYDDEGNTSVENVNIIEKCTIKDNNTLHIEREVNGEKIEYDIVRYENGTIVQSKSVYERLEDKYSSVEYRRETEGSSGYYIKDDLVYTDSGYLTKGVVGKAKYVLPLDKQIGTCIVLTHEGRVFELDEIAVQTETFKELDFGYKIIEIINLPEIDGHLLLAEDGTILNMDGTIFGKV